MKQINVYRDQTVALSKHLLGACLIILGAWLGVSPAQAQVDEPFGEPPTISKAFGADSILVNGTTTLTFTLGATGFECSNQPREGAAFIDNLPSGIVVAPTPGISNTCGGAVTATAGSNIISLVDGSIPLVTGCTVTVNVRGTTAGVKNNSVVATTLEECRQLGDPNSQILTSSPATDSINVMGPPTIAKAFGAGSIPVNSSTTLTFTLGNPASNPVSLTGVAVTDSLPSGLVVATPNGLVNGCGGTPTATAGSGSVSLSGVTIASGASCTFRVNVSGTSVGTKNNTSGAVTSTNGGTGGTASASIAVVAVPTIGKAFGVGSIPVNGSTTLTFTLGNPASNPVSLTGVAFTDSLPSGLVVSTPNGLVNGCGGTPTATAGSGNVSLSGVTLASGASCTVRVNVSGTSVGTKNNTSGAVTSTNGGTGGTASASIAVVAAPTIGKAFGVGSIPVNGSTTLTFTLGNPASNPVSLTGVAFTDSLPSGLVVSTPNGLVNGCGGTPTATAGSGNVSLSGVTLASGASCTVRVNVTGSSAGTKNNVSGAVSSTNGGAGGTASASLNVFAPPVIAKVFGVASMSVNDSTSLIFTLNNPASNPTALTGVGFIDNLPSGLVVATPNGLVNGCGGAVTAVAGTGGVSLSGAAFASGASCTLRINVTGTTDGLKNNVSGAVSSTNGGTGNTASANITINAIVTPSSIPTLNTWALALLSLLFAVGAAWQTRRKAG